MERTSKQQHFRKSTPNKEKTTGHMWMERTDQQQQQPKSIETTGVANECRSVVAVSSATSTTTTATATYKLQRTLNSSLSILFVYSAFFFTHTRNGQVQSGGKRDLWLNKKRFKKNCFKELISILY